MGHSHNLATDQVGLNKDDRQELEVLFHYNFLRQGLALTQGPG